MKELLFFKRIFALVLLCSCVISECRAQLSEFDANEPIGWAALGNGTTGDQTNTVYHVTNFDEMKNAFKKINGTIKDRTVYFDADIYVPEKFFIGQAENLTLYGKPGTRLYNRVHTADQDCRLWRQSFRQCFMRLPPQTGSLFRHILFQGV